MQEKKMGNSLSFLVLSMFFCLITFHLSISSSSAIASDQLKFWSENVQNKMPNAILRKLSPLSRNDCDFYSKILFTNSEFSADANFCSLAKLACTSAIDVVATVTKTYTTTNTYNTRAAFHQVKKNEDPFSFFRQSILKKGNVLRLPNLQESLPNRAFLPPQISSKIPLTYETIAKIFPESRVGTTKETIQTTLSYCNAAEIDGETKSCPKSLEEMVGFAKSALGEKKLLLALTSKTAKGSSPELLMIRKMKKYPANKIVACHEAFLPFAAYFCHSLPSTHLYAVELVDPRTRAAVNTMLAICHMDTSAWPRDHVAFEILKFGPGEGEACHWFTELDLAWIANGSA